MDFLEQLRQQKREGAQEWEQQQAEERRRREDEEKRKRAEVEARQAAEREKSQRKAEAVFASLTTLVRAAAARGLDVVVLPEAFVEDQSQPESRVLAVNRRNYYLTGWQIPFHDLCRANGVPLTVVSERVDVAFKGVLHRTFNVLAIDLKNL
jgi:hypothetical protein